VLDPATAAEGTVRKRRYYSVVNLTNGMRKLVHDKWSVYKAEKGCGVSWSTLKGHISHRLAENIGMGKDMPVEVPKLCLLLVLPKLDKLRLVKYMTKCGHWDLD
jgi:hypothetical protein